MFDPLAIGRSLRAIRIRLGLRQLDVAIRAQVSRAFVSKLERGGIRATDLDRVERVCRALGADLDVRVRWRGEALDRVLDEGHASLVEVAVKLLRAAGWELELEATFNHFGERGAIDILAWQPVAGSLLIVEIKSVVADAQGTLAPLDRKVRIAPTLAAARGWGPATVSRLLIVRDTTTSRTRVARFEALFRAALPDRGRGLRRWLRRPERTIAGLWFLPDATSGSTRRATAGRMRVNPPRRPRGGTG